ncbi:hypothetical protein [Curtanaerobium respiraculi]|uniref:hypothetical protein n=1 Tax=Curtanaerobium respiraculi TaxID=2949669 RepID=UPI0024B3AB5A|nr:hypothetical protein [Curtanaerobium respiraculi]
MADAEGIGYLQREPISVYRYLAKLEDVEPREARLALATLLAGAIPWAKEHRDDVPSLSDRLEVECFLACGVAEEIARMYASLLSDENLEVWEARRGEGFKEFCVGTWTLKAETHSAWGRSGVHIYCDCKASIKVSVRDERVARDAVGAVLDESPYIGAENIHALFERALSSELDRDFDWYVNAEEYYAPVVEDYWENFRELAEAFCKERGLEMVDYDVSCEQSDYISD